MFTRKRQYKTLVGMTFLIVCIAIITTLISGITDTIISNTKLKNSPRQIIIDAGHGGVDPGAIANGAVEKEINLSISLILKDMLVAQGFEVIMIRDCDVSTHDQKHHTIGKIKTSDLKNRLKLIESYPNATAILIHQNKYPDSSVSGAQMFYGRKNEKSQIIAQKLQDAFQKNLQPDNKREVKKSTSSVYILNNAKNPTVLVECGFISNSKESELLRTEEYQQKVAFTIMQGLLQ
ncbi:MAG: N-acetylmuramoyl-L-alanine amidase [Oscillospiraceae bacterium]